MQLEHDPKETSWEDTKEHGLVVLKNGTGKEVARREGFQHNRKLRSGGSWDEAAIKELVEEVTNTVAPSA